jgi:hypothetical protein
VTVYVDYMAAPFVTRRNVMVMCHMIADTTEELLAMADRLGLRREWLQDAGTYREHFDLAKTKRALAVQHGAVEVTQRELAQRVRGKLTATEVQRSLRGSGDAR